MCICSLRLFSHFEWESLWWDATFITIAKSESSPFCLLWHERVCFTVSKGTMQTSFVDLVQLWAQINPSTHLFTACLNTNDRFYVIRWSLVIRLDLHQCWSTPRTPHSLAPIMCDVMISAVRVSYCLSLSFLFVSLLFVTRVIQAIMFMPVSDRQTLASVDTLVSSWSWDLSAAFFYCFPDKAGITTSLLCVLVLPGSHWHLPGTCG